METRPPGGVEAAIVESGQVDRDAAEGQWRDCILLADPGLGPVAHSRAEDRLDPRQLAGIEPARVFGIIDRTQRALEDVLAEIAAGNLAR